MLFYLKIYYRLFKSSVSLFMSHRFDFFMGVVANIVWTVGQLVSIRYLFVKIDKFQGWGFADLVLLLGLSQIYFYTAFVVFDVNLDRLPRKIINGDFDRMLTKPINIKFLASCEQVAVAQIIPMLTTVVPLIVYGMGLRSDLSATGILASLPVVILSLVIFYFISLSTAALSFFVADVQSLRDFVLRSSLNLVRIPLDIFPKLVQMALTFIIPLAFIGFYPVRVLQGGASLVGLLLVEVALVVVFYLVSDRLWKAGLKRYSGVG